MSQTPRIKLINPIEEWSEGDVCSWLNGIKMRHHAEIFRKNGKFFLFYVLPLSHLSLLPL